MENLANKAKVAVFISNPKDTYSGGRYFGLMIAEALAESGVEVYFVTNNLPVFWTDFTVFSAHQSIIVVDGWQNAKSKLPDDLSVIYVVPGTSDQSFYDSAIECSLSLCAHLTLVNFESENWFNKYAPVPKLSSNWAQWRRIASAASSIMSIAQEGTNHAKEYYTNVQSNCRFYTCYPAINTYAADKSIGVKREKRVLLLTRFNGDQHKGADQIINVITENMRDYTLTVLIGTGQIPLQSKSAIEQRCKKFNIELDWQFKLSDEEKFALYRRSSLLLFPSLFEGYGYPPIEARYCGCKVVAYELPVLKETCGDDIIFAKHGDLADFTDKIGYALKNDISVSGFNLENTASINAMKNTLLDDLTFLVNQTVNINRLKKAFLSSATKNHPKVELKQSEIMLIELSKRLRAKFKKSSGSVTFFPKFDDADELTSHYYRAAWYLPYQESILEAVNMYSAVNVGGLNSCPDHMTDAYSTDHISLKTGKFKYFLDLILADVILVWRGSTEGGWLSIIKALGIPIVNVETTNINIKEYGEYPGVTWRYLLSKEQKHEVVESSYQTLTTIVNDAKSLGKNKAVVFGTGPSLEKAYEFDFEDSVTIACNSIVQDSDLMDHIAPQVICAGDAVSHFGVSTYAEVFRRDLLSQIEKRGLFYFGTATFGYLFKVHFPDLKDKFILIEQDNDGPNFDLISVYSAPKLVSTMNIHMLPLAATFADDIYVLGCDGRLPKKDNEDFWAHAKGAQYHDLVDTGHVCHPMFSVHRQQSMYDDYGNSVAQTLHEGINEHGKRYTSLKTSYIDAFANCCLSDDWYSKKNLKQKDNIKLSDIADHLPAIPNKTISLFCDAELETLISVSQCKVEGKKVAVKGWILTPFKSAKVCFIAESGEKVWLMKRVKRPDIAKKYTQYCQDMVGFDVKLSIPLYSKYLTLEVHHNSEVIKQVKTKVHGS